MLCGTEIHVHSNEKAYKLKYVKLMIQIASERLLM